MPTGDANTPHAGNSILRELVVDDAAGSAGQDHLSAASRLVKLGNRLFVVADDEHHLAMFNLSNREPGRLVPIFELGAIDGIALSFTDGTALPGGGWLFSAAEDTSDTYNDGRCAGS